MPPNFDAMLKKLSTAKPSMGGGPYLDRGTGRVTIKSIENKEVRNKAGMTVDAFQAVVQIESCSPVADDENPPYTPGLEVTYFQFWDSEVGPNNIIAFLMAATGNAQSDFGDDLLLDPETKQPIAIPGETKPDGSPRFLTKGRAALTQITGPDQPLRGIVVDYLTTKRTTVKNKQVIHTPRFTHVVQTEEQVAARRAALDAARSA